MCKHFCDVVFMILINRHNVSFALLHIIVGYVCQPGKFECAGTDAIEGDGCIPEIYLCDGHEDCKDGHDEKGCDCKSII